MSPTPESREEAIARLTKSASELEARSTDQVSHDARGHAASSQAYRIIAELFGGVLVGLAIGFGADMVLGTAPVGIISGVLLGFALAVWMARRTANRLMAQAKSEGTTAGAVPYEEAGEE